jgi:hypothetical protein
MGSFADSPSWKWRLVVRFFGILLLTVPFAINMPFWNLAYTALSVMIGFLIVMVS